MDVVDIIIVAIVALGGWNGYRTGLIRQVTRLFGAVIAYFLSIWLKPYVAPAIDNMHILPQVKTHGVLGSVLGNLSGAVAFAAVFVVTFLLLRYAVGLLDALFSLPVISTINRLAGLIVGFAFALVFVYVGVLIANYIKSPGLERQLSHSTIVQWLDQRSSTWTLHNPAQISSKKL